MNRFFETFCFVEAIFFAAATLVFPVAELLTTKDISTIRFPKAGDKLTRIVLPKDIAGNGAKELPERRFESLSALNQVWSVSIRNTSSI